MGPDESTTPRLRSESAGRWLAVPSLLWAQQRRPLIALGGLAVVQLLAETTILLMLGVLVERLLGGPLVDAASVAPLLVGVSLLYLARFAIAPIVVALTSSMDWALRASSGARLLTSVRSLPLADLEEPETAGAWERVRGVSLEAAFKPRAVSLYAEAALQRARLAALLVVVGWFAWLPAFLLLIGAVLYYTWARREVLTFLTGHLVGTDMFRRAGYFFDLAVDRFAAKEVRLFGLADWLVDRFRANQGAGLTAVHQLRRPAVEIVLVATLSSLVIGLAFGLILNAVNQGLIGAGTAAVAGAAVLIGAVTLIAGEGWIWDLAAAPYARLVTIERTADRRAAATAGSCVLLRNLGDVEVDRLGFRYRGGPWVLRDLSLTIAEGKSLAIVGRNGAGKTTLVKLLCGLYQPLEGAIRIGETDLATLPHPEWARQLAVVFQDFVRYPLTLGDNVTLGRAAAADVSVVTPAIERAGLRDVVERLESGLESPLSRSYPSGTDLSGGEWQRVALARALAAIGAGARLMILDEPTASLDPEAEAQFNERLLELADGATTIIVSHRFPTVRRADRIAVIDGGTVAELGSHDALMAADGLYAHLFRTQAARFGEAGHDA